MLAGSDRASQAAASPAIDWLPLHGDRPRRLSAGYDYDDRALTVVSECFRRHRRRMQHDNRSHGLDTLRGVAVVSVLAFHYLNNTSVLRTNSLLPLHTASEHLLFGVDLFFVLSGFFIGASLMRSRGTSSYLSIYAVHRIARILPLYLLWLGVFCIFLLLKSDVRFGGAFPWLLDMGGLPLFSYFTFTQNWASSAFGSWGPAWLGITWTLAFEMQFYLIAAVVVFFVPVR